MWRRGGSGVLHCIVNGVILLYTLLPHCHEGLIGIACDVSVGGLKDSHCPGQKVSNVSELLSGVVPVLNGLVTFDCDLGELPSGLVQLALQFSLFFIWDGLFLGHKAAPS